METLLGALLGAFVVLVALMVLQQMQINNLKRSMEGFFRWREKGLLIGWRDKEMQRGSSEVGIEEAIGLILHHLNLQIRKKGERAVTVIEKVPKPTKKQIEAMKARNRTLAGMAAQQPPYVFYNPQRGGIFG